MGASLSIKSMLQRNDQEGLIEYLNWYPQYLNITLYEAIYDYSNVNVGDYLSLLMASIEYNRYTVFKYLLPKVDVNYKSPKIGMAALNMACMYDVDSLYAIELLENGACPNYPNNPKNLSPLYVSIELGKHDIAQALLRLKSCKVNNQILSIAVNTNNTNIVKMILNKCNPTNYVLDDYLEASMDRGNLDILHMLLNWSHNVNNKNHILNKAFRLGGIELVDTMLGHVFRDRYCYHARLNICKSLSIIDPIDEYRIEFDKFDIDNCMVSNVKTAWCCKKGLIVFLAIMRRKNIPIELSDLVISTFMKS